MSSTKTRLGHLEDRVKELEYANKLLCEAALDRGIGILPRAEVWAWLKQEAAKAKGEE